MAFAITISATAVTSFPDIAKYRRTPADHSSPSPL